MGTWGAAIFSSDKASDLTEEFADLLGEGGFLWKSLDADLQHYFDLD